MLRVLITGAGGPLGVNFARSLRAGSQQSGEEIRLIGTDANRWHLPMSLCDQTYRIPFAKEGARYHKALLEIAAKEKVDVLVPTHPVEVRAVAQLRDADKLGSMRTALPSTAVLDISDDKARTQEVLDNAGIAVPRTRLIRDDSALDLAFEELRRGEEPIWIRGSGAPGLGIGGAALPCRSKSVARAWIEHHQGWGRMAASEFLPGSNLTWMALFSHGVLVAAAARERLEYVLPHVSPSGITGAPAVSRTVCNLELEEIGEAAVRAIDSSAHGVYFVDFKGDAEDKPMVTEINGGRCGTTIHFYTEAGCNFPMLLVQLANHGTLDPLPNARRVIEADQYWVRTLDCGPVLVSNADFDKYPQAGLENL
jgi:carbamoyl-phosphate synthase large subunit